MQGVPHGFKAEGDNLPGALRIVAGEFDGGFRQRQKQGVAVGTAASRMQGSLKGRRMRWEPQPVFVSEEEAPR